MQHSFDTVCQITFKIHQQIRELQQTERSILYAIGMYQNTICSWAIKILWPGGYEIMTWVSLLFEENDGVQYFIDQSGGSFIPNGNQYLIEKSHIF